MFSSVLRRHLQSTLHPPTRHIGYFASTADIVGAENGKMGNPQLHPPSLFDPNSAFVYSVPGKGGCQYSNDNHDTSRVIKSKKNHSNGADCGRDVPSCPPGGKDCQEHKTVCPQRQRPPQPCRCLGVNEYKFRKFGECPGPCPRPKKGDMANPSDGCKGV